MCLRLGRVGSGWGWKRYWVRRWQGRARQDVALGYGESKEILILGCFVCQEAHILYFVAPSVNWDDGFLSFQGLWMASRSPRKHVCIVYTI